MRPWIAYAFTTMSTAPSSVSAETRSTHSEPYVPIEEVARRLDLPLGVLRRRAEAGDIPARREEGPNGVRYSVRLSDLGLEAEPGEDASPPGAQVVDVVGSARDWPEEPAAATQALPAAPPPPAVAAEPRAEVSQMALDPRELVAGLLDRWERTLEQRIYAEQRQRFEAELNSRQNLVKQLQLELNTSRAEQAAALADRDRRLAETERRSSELQHELEAAREAAARKRGRLFRR
jgi:type IV secretory pathway VirB10-like protein